MLRYLFRTFIIQVYQFCLKVCKNLFNIIYFVSKQIVIFIFRIQTNEAILRQFWPLVKKINKLNFEHLSNEEL